MAEKSFLVRPVSIEYACDVPGCNGYMRPDLSERVAWLTDPPQFPHVCTSCGTKMTFTTRYPELRYEPVVKSF